MRNKSLLTLLYASVFAILFIMSLTVGYTLRNDAPAPLTTEEVSAAAEGEEVSPAVELGRAVWKNNGCNSCHAPNMKDKLTGPALAGVAARWSGYPRADLFAWVRNSQALVAAGHPRAVKVWEENKKQTMSSYPGLTDEEIEGLLAFIASK